MEYVDQVTDVKEFEWIWVLTCSPSVLGHGPLYVDRDSGFMYQRGSRPTKENQQTEFEATMKECAGKSKEKKAKVWFKKLENFERVGYF